MMALHIRVILAGLLPVILAACTTQQATVPQPGFVADAAVVPFAMTVPMAIPVRPDVSYWEVRTSLPEQVFDAHRRQGMARETGPCTTTSSWGIRMAGSTMPGPRQVH